MTQPLSRILALETSGRTGSVALASEGGLVASAELSGSMRHAGELMPTVDRLLREQGWPADSISDVFVSIGPGSFTGLRIGVTVARTLAWSIGARIVAIPTVDVLARNALAADPVPPHLAVVLDAKRSQIYTAAFDLTAGAWTKSASQNPCGTGVSPVGFQGFAKTIDACLADPSAFFARCPRPLAVLGEGVDYHREAITAAGVTVLDATLWRARAENVYHVGLELARAGTFTEPGDLIPLYIRRPEAEEKWEKLHPPANPTT